MAQIVVTQDNTTVVVSNGDTVIIDIPGGGNVTIKAAPGANVKRINIEFRGDDHADTVKFDLSTFSTNNLHIDIKDYDPSDTIALVGGFNRYVDPNNVDEYNYSYIGADGNTYTGYIRAKDKGERDFTDPDRPINICFAAGAIIDTELGPRPIESLLVGDLIRTQDNGLQPIRWIGKRTLDSLDLIRNPQLCPVRINAGALGNNLPYTDLSLSPQHCILLDDWRASYLFGQPQVLVAIKHLINDQGIRIDKNADTVTYFHLLFDRHEIIHANGVPAESLHTGDMALTAIGDEAIAELELIFPDLPIQFDRRKTARPILKSYEAETAAAYLEHAV